MNYPIAITHEPGKAYGVQVPDPPAASARETPSTRPLPTPRRHLPFTSKDCSTREKIPPPQAIESHSANPDCTGAIWAIASVDLAALAGKSKRLNISLPERVLRRIDAAAGKTGESRSGFIARIALEAV